MAKRVPSDEPPYNPVAESLVRTVLSGGPTKEQETETAAVGPPQPSDAAEKPPLAKVAEELRPAAAQVLNRERLSREKRVLLTQSEELELERIVNRVAAELSTPVKLSHILRACITILRHAQDRIVERARQASPLTRPPNGDPGALADFEHRLAQILSAALRDAPPLR